MMGRRANGEGSVYRINENKWGASIQNGFKPDGSPFIKYFSAKTEREVRKKLNEYKKDMNGSGYNATDKTTLSEYCDIWLSVKSKTLKPLSYTRLKSTIDTHIKPEIGCIPFSQVTTKDIQELIDKLSLTKSDSVIKKVYSALSAMYSYNLNMPLNARIIDYNPCNNVSLTKSKKRIETPRELIFNDNELDKIKCEINRSIESTGQPLYPYGKLYLVLLNTGLRLGELLALNKSDIDFESKTITVNKNIIEVKNKDGKGYSLIIQDEPKTFSGNRIISLNESSLGLLNDLFTIYPNTNALALNNNSRRVSPSNAEKTFTQILKKSGVLKKGRGCHALRHTFASKLFEKGIDVKIISNILGHSSVKITSDIYITIIQKHQAKMINLIPDI